MTRKETIKISGMSCSACALRIEKGLNKLEGVKNAAVNYAVENAAVEYDDSTVTTADFENTIRDLGYDVIKEAPADSGKAELQITGMTCAACSARIEKKLAGLPGVSSANVNLTTEKATVDFDSSKIKVSDMIAAVEELGYGAQKAQELTRDAEKEAREREIRSLKTSLIVSAVLTSPLLLAMVLSLLGIDVPFLHNEYFQLIIATPVQFLIGWRYYKHA